MAKNSKIEWTDHTFNPWWGCTKVSDACDHCYAETWAKRTGHQVWGHRGQRRLLSDDYWRQPLKWNRECEESGTRRRVFCASMADVFEWRADLNSVRLRLWKLVEATPSLDWLLLTKRPHLTKRLVPWREAWPENVWLGATVENQRFAEVRIPHLLESNARIRFISCEPLLGMLDISPWLKANGIDWVITGGETGANSRPSDPEWFRSLKDQCLESCTAFHFKQWGDWFPLNEEAELIMGSRNKMIRDHRYSVDFIKTGKKKNGRILDGQSWDGLPNPDYS